MKNFPYYLFLLLFSTACVSDSTNSVVTIESWEFVNHDHLNKIIQKAYKENLTWVKKPELYIFNLVDFSDLKNISYEFSADNIESPQNINISITRDGFLDDSVRGDIQKIKLSKSKNKKWKVMSLKKSTRCWRSENQVYSSKPCP